MNNVTLLTALLATLMASAKIAVAAAETNEPLLEPLYPENYQEEEERDLRYARLRLDGDGDSTATASGGSGGISGSGGVPTGNLFKKSSGGGISGTGNVQSTMLRKVSPTTESEEQLRARLDEAVDGGKLNLFGIPLLDP